MSNAERCQLPACALTVTNTFVGTTVSQVTRCSWRTACLWKLFRGGTSTHDWSFRLRCCRDCSFCSDLHIHSTVSENCNELRSSPRPIQRCSCRQLMWWVGKTKTRVDRCTVQNFADTVYGTRLRRIKTKYSSQEATVETFAFLYST